MNSQFARRKNWVSGDMTAAAVDEDLRNLRQQLMLGIQGTLTNDNALPGMDGEYIQSVVSTAANVGASGTYFDATSISLTAGDWDVTGVGELFENGATFTAVFFDLGISTTSGNSGTGLILGSNSVENNFGVAITAFTDLGLVVPSYRVSLNATTTHYLKMQVGVYTVGTPQYQCRLSARRIR